MAFRKDVDRHIVTKGDYGMLAAGSDLYTIASGNIHWNVAPGQLVAYTVANGAATVVDNTTLAAGDLPELFIGVGYDSNGDGVTDDIRYIGLEDVAGCEMHEASTCSPKCGAPEIVDFYFDCTKCDETYSLMVRVDDNRTRSFSPWNKSFAEYTASITTDCASCEDCDKEHNCKEIACKMADQLNAEIDLKIGDEGYPDWKGEGLPRPFWATRLHDRSLVYCLSPAGSGDCSDCNYIDDITQITINSEVINLVGTANPADGTQTLLGQLESLVDQINQAFEDTLGPHSGSAYITGSYQNCCPFQLHVNTCDATFAITGLVPETDENPFEEYGTFTNTDDCVDCPPAAASTFAPTCGIRVIAEKISPDCDCFINKPLAFYGRKIDVLPFGDVAENSWKQGYYRTVRVQEMELPSNFGGHIQWLEYQQDVGGSGRAYNRSNNNQGWLNLPGAKSRVRNAVTAECHKNYCSYYIRTKPYINPIDNNRVTFITVNSNIHIPHDDATTIASWEAFYTALLGFSPTCRQLSAVNCDVALGACQ